MRLLGVTGGALVVLGLLREAAALPSYLANIPNSNFVKDCSGAQFNAIGHNSRFGGGARNPFGMDYERSQTRTWAEICPLDSDGDGMTNGEELGDPLCEWRSSADDGMLMMVVGHPGIDCFGPAPVLSLEPHVWAHGILMVLAWLVFAPIGIVLTLLNKTSKAPKVKSWFKAHQAFLTTTCFLTFIAFVIMWNAVGFKLDTTHPRIGFAVVILAIIQPLGGVFRPHNPPMGQQKSKTRLGWEYAHQWLGRTIMALAIAATVLGLDLAGRMLEDLETTDALSTAVIALFCIAAAVLAIYVVGFRKDERSNLKDGKSVEEKAGQSTASSFPQKGTSMESKEKSGVSLESGIIEGTKSLQAT